MADSSSSSNQSQPCSPCHHSTEIEGLRVLFRKHETSVEDSTKSLSRKMRLMEEEMKKLRTDNSALRRNADGARCASHSDEPRRGVNTEINPIELRGTSMPAVGGYIESGEDERLGAVMSLLREREPCEHRRVPDIHGGASAVAISRLSDLRSFSCSPPSSSPGEPHSRILTDPSSSPGEPHSRILTNPSSSPGVPHSRIMTNPSMTDPLMTNPLISSPAESPRGAASLTSSHYTTLGSQQLPTIPSSPHKVPDSESMKLLSMNAESDTERKASDTTEAGGTSEEAPAEQQLQFCKVKILEVMEKHERTILKAAELEKQNKYLVQKLEQLRKLHTTSVEAGKTKRASRDNHQREATPQTHGESQTVKHLTDQLVKLERANDLWYKHSGDMRAKHLTEVNSLKEKLQDIGKIREQNQEATAGLDKERTLRLKVEQNLSKVEESLVSMKGLCQHHTAELDQLRSAFTARSTALRRMSNDSDSERPSSMVSGQPSKLVEEIQILKQQMAVYREDFKHECEDKEQALKEKHGLELSLERYRRLRKLQKEEIQKLQREAERSRHIKAALEARLCQLERESTSAGVRIPSSPSLRESGGRAIRHRDTVSRDTVASSGREVGRRLPTTNTLLETDPAWLERRPNGSESENGRSRCGADDVRRKMEPATPEWSLREHRCSPPVDTNRHIPPVDTNRRVRRSNSVSSEQQAVGRLNAWLEQGRTADREDIEDRYPAECHIPPGYRLSIEYPESIPAARSGPVTSSSKAAPRAEAGEMGVTPRMWTCATCTYDNSSLVSLCEMCSRPNPKRTESDIDRDSGAAQDNSSQNCR